jgi:hypothetical protein
MSRNNPDRRAVMSPTPSVRPYLRLTLIDTAFQARPVRLRACGALQASGRGRPRMIVREKVKRHRIPSPPAHRASMRREARVVVRIRDAPPAAMVSCRKQHGPSKTLNIAVARQAAGSRAHRSGTIRLLASLTALHVSVYAVAAAVSHHANPQAARTLPFQLERAGNGDRSR